MYFPSAWRIWRIWDEKTLSLVAIISGALGSKTLDGRTSDSEFISNKESLTVGHNLARNDRGMEVHVDASLSVLPKGLADLEEARSLARRGSSGSPYLHTARRLKSC